MFDRRANALPMFNPAAIAERIEAFELAWRSGSPPEVAAFLHGGAAVDLSPDDRLSLLCELAKIDLEYRWKSHGSRVRPLDPQAWLLEDYVRSIPDFGSLSELPIDLIAEEYRVRHRWGDRPGTASFVARFGNRAEEVESALARIDADLIREGLVKPTPKSGESPARMAPSALDIECDSRAPLSYIDFTLERFLGAGGMGKVYRARRHGVDRPCAVKVLRKAYLNQPEAVERFLEEARILARLRHSNIVGVHGVGRTKRRGYFIAMDLLPGPDLARVTAAGSIAIAQAVDWTADVACAIEYAHQQGIVHCDLKPANVLLDDAARPVVTDFGLARSLAVERPSNGEWAGTVAFMAPEQIDEVQGPVGPAVDVFGLGALLYALLAGRSPFPGKTFDDVIVRRATQPCPAPLRALRSDVPPTLEAVCLKCLSPRPADRYPSAAAVAIDLRQVADSLKSIAL